MRQFYFFLNFCLSVKVSLYQEQDINEHELLILMDSRQTNCDFFFCSPLK